MHNSSICRPSFDNIVRFVSFSFLKLYVSSLCMSKYCWRVFFTGYPVASRITQTCHVMKTLRAHLDHIQLAYRVGNAIIYMLNCVYTNLDLPAGTVRVVFFTFPVHSIPSGQPSRLISWQRGKWMPLSCPGLLITWQEDDNMCVFNIVYKKDISYTAVPQRGILIRSYSPSTPWISAKDLLSSEVFRCLWWLDASVRVIRWSTGLWWTPLSEAWVESSSQSDKEQAHTEKK